jgi:hypothetical protein
LEFYLFIPGEQTTRGVPPNRPSEYIYYSKEKLKNTIIQLGLNDPSAQEVMRAMEEYDRFSSAEAVRV